MVVLHTDALKKSPRNYLPPGSFFCALFFLCIYLYISEKQPDKQAARWLMNPRHEVMGYCSAAALLAALKSRAFVGQGSHGIREYA